jgi:hypothetical protein
MTPKWVIYRSQTTLLTDTLPPLLAVGPRCSALADSLHPIPLPWPRAEARIPLNCHTLASILFVMFWPYNRFFAVAALPLAKLTPRILRLRNSRTTNFRVFPDWLRSHQTHRVEISRSLIVATPNAAPALLHICHESRDWGLSIYLEFGLRGYLNLSFDSLVFMPEIVSTIVGSSQLQSELC